MEFAELLSATLDEVLAMESIIAFGTECDNIEDNLPSLGEVLEDTDVLKELKCAASLARARARGSPA